jgi:hypothetical protein
VTIRMDRHGNVTRVKPEGRKARQPWLRREVDRWRAGLLDDEGLAEALMSELGWKYDPGQPRAPSGSPQGGQWVSRETPHGIFYEWEGEGSGVVSHEPRLGYTSDVGGMDLARQHEQAIYKMAGSTDAYGREHGTVIGEDGKAGEIVRGDERAIRLRNVKVGDQGTIHTHPSQDWMHDPEVAGLAPEEKFTGPSPRDIQVHINAAWESNNENFTTTVVSLSIDDPRVRVTTVKGWPKGGPRKIETEMKRFVSFHATGGISIQDPVDFRRRARAAIKDYTTTVLGLEWEEEFFG